MAFAGDAHRLAAGGVRVQAGHDEATIIRLAETMTLGAATCADLGQYTDFVAARGDLGQGAGRAGARAARGASDPTVEPV